MAAAFTNAKVLPDATDASTHSISPTQEPPRTPSLVSQRTFVGNGVCPRLWGYNPV